MKAVVMRSKSAEGTLPRALHSEVKFAQQPSSPWCYLSLPLQGTLGQLFNMQVEEVAVGIVTGVIVSREAW